MNAASIGAGYGFATRRIHTPIIVRAWRVATGILQVIVIWLAAVLVMPWLGNERRRRMIERFARGMLGVFRIKIAVRGVPAAEGPAVFVANHVSWLDSHLLKLVAPACFVAKTEVAHYPIFGTVVRQLGAIFIRRGNFRDAMRVRYELAATLRAGHQVAFFPEGTTTNGSSMNYFYPALFQAAVDSGAAVQPIAIRYTHPDGKVNFDAGFTGEMTIAESIVLLLKWPVIHAEVTLCEPIAPHGSSRRELAAITRAVISEQLGFPPFAARPRRMPWINEAAEERTSNTESPRSNAPAPSPVG
ncbi:MAG TPA: lysophospholipid acyltransferase family protein [Candidatus Binataceae bacterium]|nr:lysophospholipid acyltransferase family protein [Candidatus Binataceae bacterium]